MTANGYRCFQGHETPECGKYYGKRIAAQDIYMYIYIYTHTLKSTEIHIYTLKSTELYTLKG